MNLFTHRTSIRSQEILHTGMNILIFPFSLMVMFGRMLKNMRHATVIYGVMMLMLAATVSWSICWDTLEPNPAFTEHAAMVDANHKPHKIAERAADWDRMMHVPPADVFEGLKKFLKVDGP